jgi:hypothetical protein
LNRFRVAFATLVLVATATTVLAGWGLAASFVPLSGGFSAATSTTFGPESASSATSYYSTNYSGPNATSTVTNSVSTATTAESTTTTAAGEAVTTTTTATTTSQNSGALASLGTFGAAATPGESLLREVQNASLLLAPVCWVVLGGMWVWRGRVRARYSEMGFGSDVFELFMKMKGGATRIRVLNTLTTPKDRLQLAEELGVDWKTVDRHVQILNKYGFVREQAAYGTVRLYEVTPMGKMLLNLFDDLERTDGPVAKQPLRLQEERPSGS